MATITAPTPAGTALPPVSREGAHRRTIIKAFIRRHPVLTYFALPFALSWGAALLLHRAVLDQPPRVGWGVVGRRRSDRRGQRRAGQPPTAARSGGLGRCRVGQDTSAPAHARSTST